jgi:hypothetical protein
MLRDHSLAPAEALRLVALGMLAEAPRRYGDLAAEIRHLTSHIIGPSIELMGSSLELLRYEGLVEAIEGQGMADNALLGLALRGREVLMTLLRAPLNAPGSQFNRLFLVLKLRFLDLLSGAERARQIALIAGWYRSELARIEELRGHDASSGGLLLPWLEQEAAQIRAHLAWLDAASAEAEPATADP